VLGAVAVTGLFLLIQGLRKRTTDYGRWLMEKGTHLFVAPTVLNYLVGFWFLAKLPNYVVMTFMGRDLVATVLLVLGLLLPLAAVVHLVLARGGKAPMRQAVIGIGSGMLTVAIMVVLRDVVRNAYIAPFFRPAQLPVAPQWGVIALFFVIFLAGLATLTYMLRAVVKAHQAVSTTAAALGK